MPAAPQGDLATWATDMEALIQEAGTAVLRSQPIPDYLPEAMRVHLAAMPKAQPDADALLHEFEEIVHGQGQMCDEMTCPHTDCLAARLRDYLAGPPQAQPDAELLKALREIGRLFSDGESHKPITAITMAQIARAAIAQAKQGAAPPAPDKLCVFCKKPMGDEPTPPNAAFGLHRRCK